MKIGIITFHWAANYGAILQAYALQTYLSGFGNDVRIIDYKPYGFDKSLFRLLVPHRPGTMLREARNYFKDKRVDAFRKKYLHLTERYGSLQELRNSPPDVDVLICGSDQIWTPGFSMSGEGGKTSTYYLDFGNSTVKRVAYAVSFGCQEYPGECSNYIKPLLERFEAISVRESSGIEILRKMGIENSTLVSDPTAFLTSKQYMALLDGSNTVKKEQVCIYMLRKQEKRIKTLIKETISSLKNTGKATTIKSPTVEKWLEEIARSSFVITNSFHGIMMCLKFHTPFIAITETGTNAGMNDRLYTLLQTVGLEDRIISCEKPTFLKGDIDWEKVDSALDGKVRISADFLKKYLSAGEE